MIIMNDVLIDEAIYNYKFIVMSSANIDECISVAFEHQKEVFGLMFSRYKGFESNSFEFLRDMPWIRRLVFVDDFGDLSVVSNLNNLEFLQVANPQNIDFSGLKNLKEYSGAWPSGNDSFYEASGLEVLSARKGPNQKDLKFLCNLNGLRSLTVTQLSCESLEGIEGLNNLEELGIHYCRKLNDIDHVRGLKTLGSVHFQSCKKIKGFNALSTLKKLYQLNFEQCGELNNLEFLLELSNLKALFFYGTAVASNDLSPILSCRNLDKLGFNNKKFYSHTLKELKSILDLDFQGSLLN